MKINLNDRFLLKNLFASDIVLYIFSTEIYLCNQQNGKYNFRVSRHKHTYSWHFQ